MIRYVFETRDWKGLPAEFSLVFVRSARRYTLCGKTVELDAYEAFEQTNIVFDLCVQIRKIRQPGTKD